MTYSRRKEGQRAQADGAGTQMGKNLEALSKRKEDLSKLEKMTADMKDSAGSFAANAAKLRERKGR